MSDECRLTKAIKTSQVSTRDASAVVKSGFINIFELFSLRISSDISYILFPKSSLLEEDFPSQHCTVHLFTPSLKAIVIILADAESLCLNYIHIKG